jgi:hypothetical protein
MYPNIIARLNDAVLDLEQWFSEKGNDPIIVES